MDALTCALLYQDLDDSCWIYVKEVYFSCSLEIFIHNIHYVISHIPQLEGSDEKSDFKMWIRSGDCLLVTLGAYLFSFLPIYGVVTPLVCMNMYSWLVCINLVYPLYDLYSVAPTWLLSDINANCLANIEDGNT